MKITPLTTSLGQWRGLRNWTMAATFLLFLATAGVLRAQLVTNITIYQDNFARTGVLNGSAPDTVNLPGATWQACNNPEFNAQLQTDGSEIALTNTPGTTNGIYLNGFLPFTPQVGHIYTLSCKIKPVSGGAQWLAMGFAVNPVTNNYYASYKCGAGWFLVTGNGTQVQAFGGPGGGNGTTYNVPLGNVFNTFTVVLNTTTGNQNYGWTTTFYTNGVLEKTYVAPYCNYPVQYVGIGADAAQGYFQQFTLTDVLMRQSPATITEQPQNTTAQVGQTATLWVAATNGYPSAAYQWMTNSSGGPTGVIVGATNAAYTTPVLDMSYNGLNYSVAVTNALGSTTSASAALTVMSGPPSVYSAAKTKSTTQVVVAFSKAVDPVTGLNAGNYALTINGAASGVSVLSASYYGGGSNNVILTTSILNTNAGYYLNVQNIKDLFGDAMSGVTTVPVLPAGLVFYVRGDSGVVLDNNGLVDQWLDQTTNAGVASQFFGVPTAGISSTAARPTMSAINGRSALGFGSPSKSFLMAPSTPILATLYSNVTFYAVDQFSSESPANEIVNKTWGNLPAPFDWAPGAGETVQYGNGGNNAPASGTGATLTLNTPWVMTSTLAFPAPGGTTNFAFYLNGNANGSGAIRGVVQGMYDGGLPLWIGGRSDLVNGNMKGQIAEILLFNTTLSGADRTNVDNYLGQKYYTFAITQDLPASTTTSNGFSVTYTFGASQGSVHGFALQWQKNGSNIPGVTGTTYTTPVLGPGDNGETYDVVVTFPNGSTTTSTVNTLTVVSQPPYVAVAGIPIWNTNEVYVLFDEAAVDPATAAVAANYSLNNGATVLSAAMGDTPNKVILTTSPLTWNANPGFYTLSVANVNDVYGNTIVSASPPVGLYPPTALWVKANTGVTLDGGDGVSQWNDLSGNGNNLTGFGADSGTDPVLTNNNYGDIVVRFTGTNDSQLGAPDSQSLAILGDMSVYTVMNFASLVGSTNGEIVSKTGNGAEASIAAPYDYYMTTAGSTFYRGNGAGTTVGVNYGGYTATNVPSTGVPHIIGVMEQGNTVSDFIDGNPAGTGLLSSGYNEANDADVAGQYLDIGVRGDNHNRLNGDIAEMIIASTGSMSSNDLVLLDNYLSLGHRLPIGTNSFPVITQEPVTSTNVGLNATLTVPVGVSGSSLSLQWYDTTGSPIAGQTSATLTVNNDQTSDAYYLVASNAFGSITSSVVSVTVISGPLQIFTQPENSIYTTAGSAISLFVGAYGPAPLSYQWQFFNGSSWVNLADNGRIVGTQSAALEITNVYATDAGSYQVVVADTSGSVTSKVAGVFILGYQPTTLGNGQGWFAPSTSDAKFSNNLLVLTTNGLGQSSYFFTIPQYIGAFEASFTYQAGYATTPTLADGTAFVLQNDPRGTSAIGTAGGELCVGSTGGTQITPSVELELNLYPGNGVGGVGYSMDANGNIGPVLGTGSVNLTNALVNDGPGDPITINMSYARGYMALTFTDLVTTASFATNMYLPGILGSDLVSILGANTAYIGFTASFGGDTAVQTITNFSFISIPTVNIQANSGTNVSVSWPGSIEGYTLQQNSNLTTANWLDVTNQPVLTNGLNEVIIPQSGEDMFYRLTLEAP